MGNCALIFCEQNLKWVDKMLWLIVNAILTVWAVGVQGVDFHTHAEGNFLKTLVNTQPASYQLILPIKP